MAAIVPTARKVSPLKGAICRPFTLGGAANVGDEVYVATDGDVEQADADAQASSMGRGVIVSIGTEGATSGIAGDRASVCVFGPVNLSPASALTIGAPVYTSTTAGAMDQTAPAAAGDYPFAIGWAESANVLFVDPQIAVPTVNS